MSCFSGHMKEYDRVSLDRFDGKNLQSTVYFLSHLHEDHTAGLGNELMFNRLKTNKNIFLYCSEVTEVLLCASVKYRHLAPHIKSLGINTPTRIEIPDPHYEHTESVTVTLLPAFHCPGSVMFLIEGNEGTVLYTGDFRWEHFDIEQMHHLRSGELVKKVKSLYIDTTFCTPQTLHIPSRQQCIEAVYQVMREWTVQSPQHVVYIYLRAQYGHEPLLNAVAARLNKKVHVTPHKYAVFQNIVELMENFTDNGLSTQIHACDKMCMVEVDGEMVRCKERHDADKVLVILPTTMYFTQFTNLTLDKIIKNMGDNFYRACYSFHSSYTEVKDLIAYLKPDNVWASVKSPNDSSLAVTQHRLNTMLKECKASGEGSGEVILVEPEGIKELGTLKTRGRNGQKRKAREPSSESESLDFGTPVKQAMIQSESPMSQEGGAKTRRGRGRGRGKEKIEAESQPVGGATRRSSRRLVASSPPENSSFTQITPKKRGGKAERTPSPDLFTTPVKNDNANDVHSSYAGSHHSGSEMDLTFSSQKSLDAALGSEAQSWSGGSFLAAVSSSMEDESRICVFIDEEQTDESYEDVSQIVKDVEHEEEAGLNLEDIVAMSESPKDEGVIRSKTRGRGRGRGKARGGRSRKSASNKTQTPTKVLAIDIDKEQSDTSKQDSDNLKVKSAEEIEIGSMAKHEEEEKVGSENMEEGKDEIDSINIEQSGSEANTQKRGVKGKRGRGKKIPTKRRQDLSSETAVVVEEEDLNNKKIIATECNITDIENKFSDNVEKTEDNVEKMEDIVEKTGDNVEKMEDNVVKTEENVEKIEDNVEKIEDNVVKTEDNVEKIEDNVEKTEDIVEKTEDNVVKTEGLNVADSEIDNTNNDSAAQENSEIKPSLPDTSINIETRGTSSEKGNLDGSVKCDKTEGVHNVAKSDDVQEGITTDQSENQFSKQNIVESKENDDTDGDSIEQYVAMAILDSGAISDADVSPKKFIKDAKDEDQTSNVVHVTDENHSQVQTYNNSQELVLQLSESSENIDNSSELIIESVWSTSENVDTKTETTLNKADSEDDVVIIGSDSEEVETQMEVDDVDSVLAEDTQNYHSENVLVDFDANTGADNSEKSQCVVSSDQVPTRNLFTDLGTENESSSNRNFVDEEKDKKVDVDEEVNTKGNIEQHEWTENSFDRNEKIEENDTGNSKIEEKNKKGNKESELKETTVISESVKDKPEKYEHPDKNIGDSEKEVSSKKLETNENVLSSRENVDSKKETKTDKTDSIAEVVIIGSDSEEVETQMEVDDVDAVTEVLAEDTQDYHSENVLADFDANTGADNSEKSQCVVSSNQVPTRNLFTDLSTENESSSNKNFVDEEKDKKVDGNEKSNSNDNFKQHDQTENSFDKNEKMEEKDTGNSKIEEKNKQESELKETPVIAEPVKDKHEKDEHLGKNIGESEKEDSSKKPGTDDDVYEVVDLTGEDFGAERESEPIASKGGKKKIKISFSKSKDQILKEQKSRKLSKRIAEAIEDAADQVSEDEDVNEISSSPEWLSTKKAKDGAGPLKSKKRKFPSALKALEKIEETLKGIDESLNENDDEEMTEKDREEREEMKRQAMGFVCETDSESELESSEPDSPTGSVLYDDYLELSSGDSDHEGGGGAGRGKGTHGRKSGKETRNGNQQGGNSGSGSDGQWLNSRRSTGSRPRDSTEEPVRDHEKRDNEMSEKRPIQSDNVSSEERLVHGSKTISDAKTVETPEPDAVDTGEFDERRFCHTESNKSAGSKEGGNTIFDKGTGPSKKQKRVVIKSRLPESKMDPLEPAPPGTEEILLPGFEPMVTETGEKIAVTCLTPRVPSHNFILYPNSNPAGAPFVPPTYTHPGVDPIVPQAFTNPAGPPIVPQAYTSPGGAPIVPQPYTNPAVDPTIQAFHQSFFSFTNKPPPTFDHYDKKNDNRKSKEKDRREKDDRKKHRGDSSGDSYRDRSKSPDRRKSRERSGRDSYDEDHRKSSRSPDRRKRKRSERRYRQRSGSRERRYSGRSDSEDRADKYTDITEELKNLKRTITIAPRTITIAPRTVTIKPKKDKLQRQSRFSSHPEQNLQMKAPELVSYPAFGSYNNRYANKLSGSVPPSDYHGIVTTANVTSPSLSSAKGTVSSGTPYKYTTVTSANIQSQKSKVATFSGNQYQSAQQPGTGYTGIPYSYSTMPPPSANVPRFGGNQYQANVLPNVNVPPPVLLPTPQKASPLPTPQKASLLPAPQKASLLPTPQKASPLPTAQKPRFQSTAIPPPRFQQTPKTQQKTLPTAVPPKSQRPALLPPKIHSMSVPPPQIQPTQQVESASKFANTFVTIPKKTQQRGLFPAAGFDASQAPEPVIAPVAQDISALKASILAATGIVITTAAATSTSTFPSWLKSMASQMISNPTDTNTISLCTSPLTSPIVNEVPTKVTESLPELINKLDQVKKLMEQVGASNQASAQSSQSQHRGTSLVDPDYGTVEEEGRQEYSRRPREEEDYERRREDRYRREYDRERDCDPYHREDDPYHRDPYHDDPYYDRPPRHEEDHLPLPRHRDPEYEDWLRRRRREPEDDLAYDDYRRPPGRPRSPHRDPRRPPPAREPHYDEDPYHDPAPYYEPDPYYDRDPYAEGAPPPRKRPPPSHRYPEERPAPPRASRPLETQPSRPARPFPEAAPQRPGRRLPGIPPPRPARPLPGIPYLRPARPSPEAAPLRAGRPLMEEPPSEYYEEPIPTALHIPQHAPPSVYGEREHLVTPQPAQQGRSAAVFRTQQMCHPQRTVKTTVLSRSGRILARAKGNTIQGQSQVSSTETQPSRGGTGTSLDPYVYATGVYHPRQ